MEGIRLNPLAYQPLAVPVDDDDVEAEAAPVVARPFFREQLPGVAARGLFFGGPAPVAQPLPPEVTLPEIRALVDARIGTLLEVITELNFSRGYEDPKLHFPSHESFAPLMGGLLRFNREFSEAKRDMRAGSLDANAYYNRAMTDFIVKLATQIQSGALYSRALELDRVKSKTLVSRDGHSREDHMALVKEQIRVLVNRPVKRPLLELRELLNVPLYSWHKRKANNSEIGAFKFLWDFYQRHMKPQGY